MPHHFNRKSITRTAEPSVEPVTLSEAKEFLRIDSGDTGQDTTINRLITTARNQAELFTRRSFITQTWKLTLDDFVREHHRYENHVNPILRHPSFGPGDIIELPRGPLQSVTSITTFNDDNNSSTFDLNNVHTDLAGDRVVLDVGKTWPTDLRPEAAVEVVYDAGYGDNASDVPSDLRQAILVGVNFMFENRGCADIPKSSKELLEPFRDYAMLALS